jgi:ribonuclease R
VTQLPHDYYHFDPIRKTLSGERRGTEFRLGDAVTVQVMKASMEERKIDFRLVEPGGDRAGVDAPRPALPARRKKQKQ